MILAVFIAPHERYDAIEVYRYRLTEEQIRTLRDEDDESVAIFRLVFEGPTSSRLIREAL